MADPNLRYTDLLELPYPAAELDPWDEQYQDQMEALDLAIMYAQQRAGLVFSPESWSAVSWADPMLTTSKTLTILVPRWGGSIVLNAGSWSIPDGSFLSITPTQDKWNNLGIASNVSIGSGELPPESIPLFYNDSGTCIFMMRETSTPK